MMNIKKILFIITMLVSLTGCFYEKCGTYQPKESERVALPHFDGINLTADDVIRLSEKENSLRWSDFDEYSYYETGSGLCIRVYEINEKLSLWIGGGGTYDNDLMAFYFYLKTDDGNYIDIRTDDVKNFIKKHS
ncbi:MAG: hypothetical protein NC205_01105 [Prevotella sp.]|nr:hypothetical protein [Alistipes senegalensis]MCM1357162.1 hypothetical protein [Prevotella sp.]MCM1472534.1 hypothetical protein [Muribaculaceae bacterium]